MILIVDDNENNIYFLKKLLESKGVQIDTANNGEVALEKALKNDYSLIILDVQMPGMSGFEIAETLEGYSQTKEIPILFLSTVSADKRFITKGYRSGGIDYVTKPIDPEILMLKIEIFYLLQKTSLAMKITQQNLELEVKRRKETQLLMKSEIDHFHLMLKALLQIAFILDENNMINFVNSKWFEYSDSAQKFPKTHTADLNIDKEFQRCKAEGESLELEVRIKNRITEDYRYHLLRISPVYQNGALKNCVGTFTDIDDQKKVEREKDEFLSIASHELKTPLTRIKAYMQLVFRKLGGNPHNSEKDFVGKALDQIEKLNSLITDLLDISKIENGKLKINKKLEDLEELINSTINTIMQTYDNSNVRINCDFINITHLIYFDPLRIEQILINLLTNAMKYSPKSNQVIVRTRIENNEVKVRVTDFGIGIPEFKQTDVFRKFYRVEESSESYREESVYISVRNSLSNIKEPSVLRVKKTKNQHFTLPLN
ncbi:response regulator [Chryseobacterium fluminis]|uniref:hybrid sensor histidine kinase/response regulator n=1 Tax=Chryseobacterium fluminis TaxID=2983606 RepID=UPI00225BB6A3|nr:response regulator [Chryseobacterium sp. MMS21-Ot14]UZT97962.1 response regulator [Chryseobacterium sp. MMS21-Ot14]